MSIRTVATLFALALSTAGTGHAAGLSFDSVFAATPPWGATPSRIDWSPDGKRFTYTLASQDPAALSTLYLYDTATHRSNPLLEPIRFGKPATPSNAGWSPDGTRILVGARGALSVFTLATGSLAKLADGASGAQWSPNGDAVAFARDGNVWVVRADGAAPRKLTPSGVKDSLLQGELDRVYPEELGIVRGFAWSPNGKQIAYLQLDERSVTDFPLTDFLATHNTVALQRYPLAGEKNPGAQLREIDVDGTNDRLVYDASAKDEYLAAFGWRKNSASLDAEVLDRSQRDERFLEFDGSQASVLDEERSPSWVDVEPLPRALADGSTLWVLSRGSTDGLYRLADGHWTRLTGAYHIFGVAGVDEKRDVAYVSAAYPTRRDRSLLAVSLNGGAMSSISKPAGGAHDVVFSPSGSHYVDTYSTLGGGYRVNVVAGDTTRIAAPSRAFLTSMLPTKMLSVPSKYGPLDATMLLPARYDAKKRYPVVVYVYGGPGAPTTANRFGGQLALYHQLLAQAGFIVFSIDGPASQIDSDAHVRLELRSLGPASLAGQEIGARYLATLPYVDAKRIGIWGWSYGGYETIYAMTHSTLFKAGTAVAPVTDWRFYDSVYTERYMGTPKAFPRAYAASSVLPAARSLHGPLLIQDGTADDNVHMANTMSLLKAFVDAKKSDVWFFAYPRKTHSIAGLVQRRALYERMFRFWKANL